MVWGFSYSILRRKKERNQASGNRILVNSHITSNPKFIFPDPVFQSIFQSSRAWAVLVSVVQLTWDLLDKCNSPFQKPEAAEEHCSIAEDRLCCCQDTSLLQDVQPERNLIVIKKNTKTNAFIDGYKNKWRNDEVNIIIKNCTNK